MTSRHPSFATDGELLQDVFCTFMFYLGGQYRTSDRQGREDTRRMMNALYIALDTIRDARPEWAELLDPMAVLAEADRRQAEQAKANERAEEAFNRAMYIANGGNA